MDRQTPMTTPGIPAIPRGIQPPLALARGVRLDTEGRDDQVRLLALSPAVSWVSILAAGPDLLDRLMRHHDDGFKIHLVLARETYARYALDPENVSDVLTCHQKLYQEIHGTRYISSLENGNEPDVPPAPGSSSFSRTPELLQADIWAAERVWHSQGHALPPDRAEARAAAGAPDTAIPLWVGGSGTGQPSYYANIPDFQCHGIALHSYDARLGDWAPPQLPDVNRNLAYLLDAFWPVIQRTRRRRTRLTEIGLTSVDEAFVAWYVVQLDTYLNERPQPAALTMVEAWDWFCLSDKQVAPHGLLRADDSLKPSYVVMQGLPLHTISDEPTPTTPPEEVPVPTPPAPPAAPSPSLVAWRNRWRSVRPQALYNHDFGLETAWRAAQGAWGYPLNDLEEPVSLDGKTYSSRTFSTAGLVYWDGEKAVVLGWPT